MVVKVIIAAVIIFFVVLDIALMKASSIGDRRDESSIYIGQPRMLIKELEAGRVGSFYYVADIDGDVVTMLKTGKFPDRITIRREDLDKYFVCDR